MDAQTLKLIGEIIGGIAVAESFLIFLSNKRERILIFKLISDALWVVNLILVGGYTGALLNVIGVGRGIVFYYRDKKKWASTLLWPILFIVVTAISPIATLISGREGWYAILPAIGSIVAVISFYSRRPNFTRYTSFLANGLWLVYNILISNYSGIVAGVILLLSAAVGTVMMLVQQHQLKKAAVSLEAKTSTPSERADSADEKTQETL